MTAGALAGLRIIELGPSIATAFCGKLLAGLGAEVIKVEPPEGDPLRFAGPFPGGPGAAAEPRPNASGAFLQFNTGKQSLTLDMEVATGQDLLRRLIATADVVIESCAPGHLEARGLGHERLAEDHRGLVTVSVTPFGQTGPYRDYAANELIIYAASGYMSLAGDADREPHKAHGEQAALHTGYQAALAVMTALTARDTSGDGQWVDVAQADAAAFLSSGAPHGYIVRGTVAGRNGNRLTGQQAHSSYPSTLRPCKDGWIHAHGNFRYPTLMGEVMGKPRLNEPDVLATPHGHADEIDALMDEWLAQYDKWEVVRIAQANRLHFTEVMTPAEVLADPAYAERDFWFAYDHPEAGHVKQPGPIVRLSATPWVDTPAPAMGQANRAIWGQELGVPPDDLDRLTALRVI